MCCHFRAVEFYEESTTTTFEASNFQDNTTTTIMGDGTPPTARGIFCLNTNKPAPFASRKSLKDLEKPDILRNFTPCVLSNNFCQVLSVYAIFKLLVVGNLF